MQRRWCAKGAEEIIIPSLKYVRVANRTHSQSIKRFGRSRSTKQIILQSCSVSHVCNLPCLSDQQVPPHIPHIGFFNSWGLAVSIQLLFQGTCMAGMGAAHVRGESAATRPAISANIQPSPGTTVCSCIPWKICLANSSPAAPFPP